MAAIDEMHCGISSEEQQFWRKFSIDELHLIHVHSEKVLDTIADPIECNPCEM